MTGKLLLTYQIGAVAGEATIFVLVNLLLLLKSFSSQGPLYGLYP